MRITNNMITASAKKISLCVVFKYLITNFSVSFSFLPKTDFRLMTSKVGNTKELFRLKYLKLSNF